MIEVGLILAGLLCLAGQSMASLQFSGSLDSDLSRPTFGLQGPSSSAVSYDEKNGLNMKGPVNDLLGPPIKIATGFNQLFSGTNMAGIGSGLQANGALLNFDSRILDALAGASMLKGGALLGGSAAKVGAAKILAGEPGKKIASIIELPVKLVGVKDLAAGKAIKSLSDLSAQEAQTSQTKGAELVRQGDAIKSQAMTQIMQGAAQGVQNIGNMVQQTTGNAAAAFRLLPTILEMQKPQRSPQQQQVQQQQQQEIVQKETKSSV